MTAALGSVMGVVMGIPIVGYLIDPALKAQSGEAWVPLGPLENYPVGAPKSFSFTRSNVNGWEKTVSSYGGYVYRKSESELIVLSNRCTHLSCSVNWSEAKVAFDCPCHDAQFGVEGEVLGGPPPHPLDRYESEILEDGTLQILFPAVPYHEG
jgi:Rieske Fe-S protein